MAPDYNNNNWLSFSLSPMEIPQQQQQQQQRNHHHHQQQQLLHSDSHQYYFFDNFYAPNANWSTTKVEDMYNHRESVIGETTSSYIFEDFLGGDTTTFHPYSDTQTDTATQDDSSLTQLYDHSDFKTIAAFQAFSTNSGSEVDDSGTQQLEFATQSTESAGNELVAYQQQQQQQQQQQCLDNNSSDNGVLSLAVNQNSSCSRIVAVESDSCKKIADTFGQRTSIYRGVTRHRWTGRYEAHLWDNSCRREGQARKGRQVYLGGYDQEDKAARAYDLAALKYWGPNATTNFPVSNYTKEQEDMKNVTKQEFIASLRRKSSGFSRGASIYRGVTRHHQQGRWQARIGRVAGNKDLYLGTFVTEEEAAEAYDIAAIKFRGLNAVTNFEMNRYDVEAISNSTLPIGGAAKRLKLSLEAEQKASSDNKQNQQSSSNRGISISFAAIPPVSAIPYGVPFDSTTPYYHHNFFHHLQSSNAATADTSCSMLSAITTVPLLPPPAEFFLWPHQTY